MIPLPWIDRDLIGEAVSLCLCLKFSWTSTDRAEYRSAIFFHTPEQEKVAKEVTSEVQEK
jgi:hypothetical protein